VSIPAAPSMSTRRSSLNSGLDPGGCSVLSTR
jgi:hypothetical protein